MALVIALSAGCARERPLISVERAAHGSGIRLSLIPAPGARINARLKPAFEQRDGSVLHFDASALTPDSSYLTAPPTLDLPGPANGVVRASVCPEGEGVCRRVVVEVEE